MDKTPRAPPFSLSAQSALLSGTTRTIRLF
jgi:hypothetical protein